MQLCWHVFGNHTSALKTMHMKKHFTAISFFAVAMLLSLQSFAQDNGLDIDIDIDKKPEWYEQPWVWVVGGAVFILLLAAILRGNRK